MERRTGLLTILGFFLVAGLGLGAGGHFVTHIAPWLPIVGWVAAVVALIAAIGVWSTIPKERATMSGNSPKNVNFGTNFGQIGDNFYGRQPFELTVNLVHQVLAECPRGVPVLIEAIGSSRADHMLSVLRDALTNAGYTVHIARTYMKVPAPGRPLSVTPSPERTAVTLAPDV